MDGEFGVNRCKPSPIGWMGNKVLLDSTGNYIQFPGINHHGKEKNIKKNMHMCVNVCITESLAARQKLTPYCKYIL